MIDFLRGQVALVETEYVVIDVQGVGYQVFCPNPYVYGAKSDESISIYTHQHVREDAILLYGFETREQQQLFRKLIEVSGIGPKVAIGILSAGVPERIIAAIHQEDIAFLTKLPGIGKKTAQRMILDLKDKLDAIGSSFSIDHNDIVQYDVVTKANVAWQEAREGLKALGYTDAELERAWLRLKDHITDDEAVDSIVKKALKLLYAG